MSSSEAAFDHLQEIKNDIAKQCWKLKKHNCFSNFSPSASLQNVIFETKDLRLQFISLSSYLMFLKQFTQQQFLELNESEEIKKTIDECNKEKEVHKSYLEETERFFEKLMNFDSVEASCSNVEILFKALLFYDYRCKQ